MPRVRDQPGTKANSPERGVELRSIAPRLFEFFRRRLQHRPEDAKDLVQQVFLRWIQMPSSREVKAIESYLFKMSANVLSDFHAMNSRQVVSYDSPTAEEIGERLPYDDLTGDLAEQLGLTQQLEHILSQIPAVYRNVLLLRYRDDMRVPDIARKIGKSETRVREYLASGLEACRAANWQR